MEMKEETKKRGDEEKGRVIETKREKKEIEEKWNITTGRYWKRTRHKKKKIEKIRDRDRSAKKKKETEKMGDDEKNKAIAKKGDFRVQDDHGGTVEQYIATESEIVFAKKCLEKCQYSPIYARVDVVYDNNNKLSLSELELIEPELWFRNKPESATLLAEEVFSLLSSK